MSVRGARRGDVWIADLGLAAKVRPVLILALPGPEDRQIFTCVPHTTSPMGTEFEIKIPARFLKEGAFDVQAIITIPVVKLERKLGTLLDSQMASIEEALLRWLEISG